MSESTYAPDACDATSISVLTQPGQTALTRTPRPPHSTARVRVSPIRPCLLVLYAARARPPGQPRDAGAVDDGPLAAGQHVSAERLAQQERPRQVDLQDLPPHT